MYEMSEKWVAEGRKEGITIGEENKAKEIAFNLANKGMNAEYIADIVKMNIAVVKQWLEKAAVSK